MFDQSKLVHVIQVRTPNPVSGPPEQPVAGVEDPHSDGLRRLGVKPSALRASIAVLPPSEPAPRGPSQLLLESDS